MASFQGTIVEGWKRYCWPVAPACFSHWYGPESIRWQISVNLLPSDKLRNKRNKQLGEVAYNKSWLQDTWTITRKAPSTMLRNCGYPKHRNSSLPKTMKVKQSILSAVMSPPLIFKTILSDCQACLIRYGDGHLCLGMTLATSCKLGQQEHHKKPWYGMVALINLLRFKCNNYFSGSLQTEPKQLTDKITQSLEQIN